MPDVVDVIHQSAHAFEAEAECEAGINRRINSARPKNIRMDHSRAAELYPASAFAWTAALTVDLTGSVTAKAREIELGRRLGEREVRRPKSRDSVGAIHPFEPLGNCPFQMRHRDAFVDTEAFQLVKHRCMRHVGRVAAKHLARS